MNFSNFNSGLINHQEPENVGIPFKKVNEPIVDEFLESPSLKRLSGFTNSEDQRFFILIFYISLIISQAVFQAYAPTLHKYYKDTLTKLQEWKPSLKTIVENTVFAAATLNLGPRVKTVVHFDLKNLAWGLCAVTALGNFNPDIGGHIIFWDIKKVVRFPPGSTVLLPSAVARHSNVDIAEGEERMSLTQYSAGALFRWVDYGFKLVADYIMEVGSDVFQRRNEERWKNGLSMFASY